MGASVSTNSTDIITKALTDVSSEIIQKSINNNIQNIVINITDVEGDVTLSKVNILQKATINSKALFNNLSETENANKINEEIEKITNSTISGLNIGQISTSVSTLSNIIENCIKIKNQSLSQCQNNNEQNFKLTLSKIKGNLSITDLTIKQITENFSECILSNKNTNDLRLDTDMKIKQISSSKSEGLDIKWIAISVAIAFSSFAVVSTNAISKLIGPIMIGIGSWLTWFSYKKNKNKIINQTIYITDNVDKTLNFNGIKKIKEEKISDKNVDITSYGEATLYENFKNKIILYDMKNLEIIQKLKNNILTQNLEAKIIAGGIIEIRVKDSSKYPFTRINYNFDRQYNKVLLIKDFEGIKTESDTVYIVTENFEYTHQLKIYLKNNNFQIKHIMTYYMEPTIISYTTESNKYDLLKNNNAVIGISLIILGIVVMFTSLLKK